MATSPPPGWYDDLAGSEDHAWAMLVRGAADRRSPFHTPILATVDATGAPQARTVVLRGVERVSRTVRLHSDARADKVTEIAAEGLAAMAFYDKGAKLQVRTSGAARVHRTDAIADAAWQRTRDFSRECYRVSPPAGSPIAEGGGYAHPGDGEDGRENFAVIVCQVDAMEVLYLAAAGHRRARFTERERSWLVP